MGTRADAAKGVERFLTAAQARDRIGFEARIDRAALRQDLRRQLIEVARANGVDIEGGPSDAALDRMIAPEAFHLVRAETGQALPSAPSSAQLVVQMKVLDGRRVCLRDLTAEERCLLTFAKGTGQRGWRLVAMQATDLQIQVAGPPPR
ncbi:hypothetical protein [Phenylobacterium sp.]|uniref:hypothetical protein n=1 Tax=Phenylobacterium sp. TaxID=1871053 RepID=UPI003982E358